MFLWKGAEDAKLTRPGELQLASSPWVSGVRAVSTPQPELISSGAQKTQKTEGYPLLYKCAPKSCGEGPKMIENSFTNPRKKKQLCYYFWSKVAFQT